MDLLELESGVNPEKHWYYQSKKIPLIKYIKHILQKQESVILIDFGSGSGFFALEAERYFGNRIKEVLLIDINYTDKEIEDTNNLKIKKRREIPHVIENSIVVMMDVLEHIENDVSTLVTIKKSCKGDANYFFITVPAFHSLWSGHDVYLGHFRRYTIKSLTTVLKNAFFKPQRFYYLYGIYFPVAFFVRKLNNLQHKKAVSNMKQINPFVNSILLRLAVVEMKITERNKLFGISCTAYGKI